MDNATPLLSPSQGRNKGEKRGKNVMVSRAALKQSYLKYAWRG